MVLRGEAGVGKTALLGYLSGQLAGWHVARAAGVESEMELPYAGLHQLCGPMLDHLDRLPAPQRDALATVFGRSGGAAPDRFLVGLATLTLVAEARSSHCASSTTQASGCCSATSATSVSVASPTRNRSGAAPPLRPNTVASASRCGTGSRSRRSSMGPQSWCRPA